MYDLRQKGKQLYIQPVATLVNTTIISIDYYEMLKDLMNVRW
jgi:hypothetical protein